MRNDDGSETERDQLTRNLNELLGELRVAQAGVQILFGFLLAVVFTGQYERADLLVKSLHVTAVVFAVLATALLAAPAAWHRMLFRSGFRRRILDEGNRLVIAGLTSLALAVVVTVAMIGYLVFGPVAMAVLTAIALLAFGSLWFLAPLRRLRATRVPRAGNRP